MKVREKRKVLMEMLIFGIKILLLAGLVLFFFKVLFGLYLVKGNSMKPAIKDSDLVIFYRLDSIYHSSDVVVLQEKKSLQVRRIIAVEGDTVDIKDGELQINGYIIQEPDIYESTEAYVQGISFPVTLKEGEVFVLGDQRENSTDSRIYGPVKKKQIQGKVVTVIRREEI